FLIAISEMLNSSENNLNVHFFAMFDSINSITLLQNVVAAEKYMRGSIASITLDSLQKNINDNILL
ncbi:hypothetical protein, partial [Escherichia coli]|uniref:hypothetical protein n=1 Tax=Escherichia coli TaxID=562 RepID=UPI001BB21620